MNSQDGDKSLTREYNISPRLLLAQFGHNDQKAAANISLEEYQTNLETLATEVKSAGGTPVRLTSHATPPPPFFCFVL